jgi:predicted GNAT family acetyltransferase
MHQGVYELLNVIDPNYDNGEMLVATKEHKSIVSDYTLGFINDCFPDEKEPSERATEMADRHILNQTIYLWKNTAGKVVSMASKNRESKNAATVSLVYTPKEYRGNGYASRIVAKLSHKLLSDGKKKCNLFTDLTNPTSNSIYQKVGYKFVGESIHYNFKNDEET